MYADESIMSQQRKMNAIEAKIEALRRRDDRLQHEKHEFDRKQQIAYYLISEYPFTAKRLTVPKLRVMPMYELLRLQARCEINQEHVDAAKKL